MGKNSFSKSGGVVRLFKAFKYSMHGFANALKNEAAFRQDCMLVAAALISLIFFDVSQTGFCLVLGASALLLITELLNSAVEETVNICAPEFHPLAKRAKDMGSAAVFCALVNLVAIWAIVTLL